VRVELEVFPWLGEQLGGPAYRSRHLKWQVDVPEGETVGDLFARLAATRDPFRRLIFDPETQLLGAQVVVVLNDRLLDLSGGLHARLTDGDQLAIVPALAGGNGVAKATYRPVLSANPINPRANLGRWRKDWALRG